MEQHSTAYENTKQKGRLNKTWPQILWFLDTERTEAPSLRLPASRTCFIWTFGCQLQQINTNETHHI